jgi:uncharacterized protein (DUF608 family)
MVKKDDSACTAPGCCGSSRREFLQAVALGTATQLGVNDIGLAMAGPFDESDFARLVPPDKKLDPAWVKSLFDRGERTIYRGEDLAKIGMPIGGICAGQLYLGGDGKLWHWDIFNRVEHTNESHYAKPMQPRSPLDQGFAVRVRRGAEPQIRTMDRAGFSDVRFRGEYPIGFVEYRDPASAVQVSLQAFSPFIPLNTDDSSLPATLLLYRVKNVSREPVEIELVGWLENAVCLDTGRAPDGFRINRILREPELLMLDCSTEAAPTAPERTNQVPLGRRHDQGTMCLALFGPGEADRGIASIAVEGKPEAVFGGELPSRRPLGGKLAGAIVRTMRLGPGEEAATDFAITWHFPNLSLPGTKLPVELGRYYANRFASAAEVARYLSENRSRLVRETRLWHQTWYDSTLPYWFLDRTFANASILATSTCHRFKSGRFYGWEGVGCCAGTCTHVWHYAHAVARLFPLLERILREQVDYAEGVGFDSRTGVISHRAEEPVGPAVDGQAGNILLTYREHQMSADTAFLRRLWPKVKASLEYLIRHDPNRDGLLESAQHNTLDAQWFGVVPWLSSLYIAALAAGEAMAGEMEDEAFARECRQLQELGAGNFGRHLWNPAYGYFVQKPDPAHAQAVGSYDGCEIDQVFGQHWAFQVGLWRILPEDRVRKALRSLWTYNFTPDVGPYRQVHKAGRWYAMPGEAGLLMVTFPKGNGPKINDPAGGWSAMYFNECMNGFEYQVGGHMIWEGMVQEGLAITRAIHDRYHPSRRNPWNEVECGDHYARSMASYGVYLAACGYEYHGPRGYLAFSPRLNPDDFRGAFTTAEGWGTFSQHRQDLVHQASISMKWGRVKLKTLHMTLKPGLRPGAVAVRLAGNSLREFKHAFIPQDSRIEIEFPAALTIEAGQELTVEAK